MAIPSVMPDGVPRDFSEVMSEPDRQAMTPRIVKWVSYEEASALPSVSQGYQDSSGPEHEKLLGEAIKAQGLKFTGETHQEKCCPVFDDGNTMLFSCRAWGEVMAGVWGGSYVDWAWVFPSSLHVEKLPEGVP